MKPQHFSWVVSSPGRRSCRSKEWPGPTIGPAEETTGGTRGKLSMEAKSLGRTLWAYISRVRSRTRLLGGLHYDLRLIALITDDEGGHGVEKGAACIRF
jgi:hypothetical protein